MCGVLSGIGDIVISTYDKCKRKCLETQLGPSSASQLKKGTLNFSLCGALAPYTGRALRPGLRHTAGTPSEGSKAEQWAHAE